MANTQEIETRAFTHFQILLLRHRLFSAGDIVSLKQRFERQEEEETIEGSVTLSLYDDEVLITFIKVGYPHGLQQIHALRQELPSYTSY